MRSQKLSPRFRFAAVLFIFVTAFLALGISASVYAAPDDACGTATNIVKIDCGSGGGTQHNAIWGILLFIITIMTAGVGLLAIGGLVYGAILYTTAQNNSGQITKAKETIANVILGLVLYAFMWSLLQFLIPGGVFDSSGSSSGPSVTTSSVPTPTPTTTPSPSGGGPGSTSGAGTVSVSDIRIKNFRDASTTTNGNVLKASTLYRSAELYNISDTQSKRLGKLLGSSGLIIDVRTNAQASDHPDKSIPGVRRIHIPIAGFLDTQPAATDPARMKQFAKVFRAMANNSGPVLIHCSAGKDRTGWTVAMVMGLSGATKAQIKKEYAKSVEAWPGHDPTWINSGLSVIDNKYGGSYKRYLKATGMTDAEITKLKRKFGS